jgi:hypothetical protein
MFFGKSREKRETWPPGFPAKGGAAPAWNEEELFGLAGLGLIVSAIYKPREAA